jgi:hypothetical protein
MFGCNIVRAAKRIAINKLGMKPKHVKYRCTE